MSEALAAAPGAKGAEVKAYIIGTWWRRAEWPREEVIAAAERADLVEQIRAGRLARLDEFRRAMQSIETFATPNTLVLKLSGGREVQLNVQIAVEVKAVDGSRGRGHEYQVNRRIKWFVADVEGTLANGITMDDVKAAIGARANTNHEITQNVGKFHLTNESEVEAVLYSAFEDEPTGAAAFFQQCEVQVKEAYENAQATYNHSDLKNAFTRELASLVGTFRFEFGYGGNRFVPVRHESRLRKWQAFLQDVYGARTLDLLPLVNLEETNQMIRERAQEAMESAWRDLMKGWLDRLDAAEAKHHGKPEKVDRAVELIEGSIEEMSKRLLEDIEAVNEVLGEDMAILRRPSKELQQEMLARIDNPRLKNALVAKGIIEDEDDAPDAVAEDASDVAPAWAEDAGQDVHMDEGENALGFVEE